jgi:acyl carrier protein
VYVGDRDLAAVSTLAREIGRVAQVGPEVSLFTERIAPGVAIAWEPIDRRPGMRGLSFGEHRARATAEGLVQHAGSRSSGTAADAVRQALITAGIEPARPAWNRRQRGAARAFLADPLSGSGECMYVTGDLVWMADDGTVSCVGRIDDQVKINRHRVELAELEAATLEHHAVRSAAVTATEVAGASVLSLYVVAAPEVADELPAWLAERLPSYLRPRQVYAVPHIPLTGSGKVARDQLAQLVTPVGTGAIPSSPAEPAASKPVTGTVEIIADVWRQILNRDSISSDDDFFSLGGHSLLAIRLASRLRREIGVVMPIADVFNHPRLGELAEYVDQLRSDR